MTAAKVSTVSYRNGDRIFTVKRSILFLLLTLAVHLVVGTLFREQTTKETNSTEKRLSNMCFFEDDPKFASFVKSIPDTADPSAFLRGDERIGYSMFRNSSIMEAPKDIPKPVLKFYEPVPIESEPLLNFADHNFSSASIYSSLLASLLNPEQKTVAAVPVHYPLWQDAFGSVPGLHDMEEDRNTMLFHSRDINGPTVLFIYFPDDGIVPVEAVIRHSCGSIVLDLDAKRTAEEFLSDPKNAKRFQGNNTIIRVFWNADAPVSEGLLITETEVKK